MHKLFLLFALFAASFVAPSVVQAQSLCAETCTRYHSHPTQLYRAWTLLRHLNIDFETMEPVTIQTSGYIEYTHRFLTKGPVGFVTRVGVRCVPIGSYLPNMSNTWAPSAAYPPPPWLKGAKSGGNISSPDDHYGRSLLDSPPTLVGPGRCRVEVWGVSHTTDNAYDGNAYVNIPDPTWAAEDPYNHFTLKISR